MCCLASLAAYKLHKDDGRVSSTEHAAKHAAEPIRHLLNLAIPVTTDKGRCWEALGRVLTDLGRNGSGTSLTWKFLTWLVRLN